MIMIIVDEESIILTEEDIQTIITAVEKKLNGTALSDIEPETDENSYSVTDDELEI